MTAQIIGLPAPESRPIQGNGELRELCLSLVRHVSSEPAQDADQREAEERYGAQIANAVLATPAESMADVGYKLGAAIAATVTRLGPDHPGCVLLGDVLDDFNAVQAACD